MFYVFLKMADQLEILTLSSVLIAQGSDKPGMEWNQSGRTPDRTPDS